MAFVAEPLETISVIKLHPAIGAEIRGVDLSRPLDADTARQIKDAWHEHAVLLFRDQNLTEDDQRRFASHFGPVAKRVPPKAGAQGAYGSPEWDDMMMISDNVDANGKPLGSLGHGEMWFHTDKCYHRAPASRVVPLRHRNPVRGRPHQVFQPVRRLREPAGGAEAAARRRNGNSGPAIRRRPPHRCDAAA